MPAEVLAAIKGCDVLLKGPTATPKGGTLESANVTLRRALDLYANVRPVRIPEEGVDWTFFRENTEGEYALGSRGVELPGLAMDFKVITDAGTRRIARAAFEYARKNGKKNVAIVTKANIMKKTDGKFTAICHEVAKDYPEMEVEDWYIDIMTANLVNPAIRSRFEVFILPNLYGDIITDEAAQLQGGVGTAGSANLGDRYAMFEAIHGTAPRMIEEGLGDYANPESILRAAQTAAFPHRPRRSRRQTGQGAGNLLRDGEKSGRHRRQDRRHLPRIWRLSAENAAKRFPDPTPQNGGRKRASAVFVSSASLPPENVVQWSKKRGRSDGKRLAQVAHGG